MNWRRLMSPKTEDDSLSHRSEAIVRHGKFDRSTSGLGHSRRFGLVWPMSALPSESDKPATRDDGRLGSSSWGSP